MDEKKFKTKQPTIGSLLWISEMRKGNSKLVADLYKQYKGDFVRWIRGKTDCSEELAVDVFQDSIVALYENIKKGKILAFDHSVKTYLFGIGKKVYLLHLRRLKQERFQTISLEDNRLNISQLNIKIPINDLDEKKSLLTLLLKMKEPCKSILYLFYYKEFKIKEIAENLKYKNENVVRAQKARCMTALRKAYSKKNIN